MSTERIQFPGISARAWEHPADRAALAALKQIPGVEQVLRAILGFVSDKSLRLYFMAGAVRVTERQYPKIWRLLDHASDILDIQRPELFVSNHPVANAGAVGIDKPFLLLHSALVEQLDEEEILFVLGHELGHIASGHSLYRTVVELILNFGKSFIPLPKAVLSVAMLGLLEWYRKSELSADRAGLLTVQDPSIAYSAFMKMAGGRDAASMNLDEYLGQALEYEKGNNAAEDLMKLLNVLGQTHPFPVLRISELKPWAEAGSYREILKGQYPKKNDDTVRPEQVFRDFEGASKSYAEDFDRYGSGIKDGLSHLGKGLESAGKEAEKLFRNFFKGN